MDSRNLNAASTEVRSAEQINNKPGPIMAEKIGFVGVGRMGANMARRLREVGYAVVAVYDVRRKAAQSLAQESGGEACSTLARVTALSDVVITVVTDDTAMRRIYSDKKDNLFRNAAGKVFINCATITPKVHVEVGKWGRRAGGESLEAGMATRFRKGGKGPFSLLCGGTGTRLGGVK